MHVVQMLMMNFRKMGRVMGRVMVMVMGVMGRKCCLWQRGLRVYVLLGELANSFRVSRARGG
jgi:hypothetical protein